MTDFLNDPGTNGFIQAPFSLIGTTDLSGLASGSGVLSTVGVLNAGSWANAAWGELYFQAQGAFTPTAGGFLAIWFLRSFDGGTTFETVIATAGTGVMAIGRPPDAIVNLYEGGAAWASGNTRWASPTPFKTPFSSHKCYIQNLSGVALGANNHILKGMGVAISY